VNVWIANGVNKPDRPRAFPDFQTRLRVVAVSNQAPTKRIDRIERREPHTTMHNGIRIDQSGAKRFGFHVASLAKFESNVATKRKKIAARTI
jgi:hypothetical protein